VAIEPRVRSREGERGSRHDHLRDLLRELTGAEDAISSTTTRLRRCSGSRRSAWAKEIVVSRGELIESAARFGCPRSSAVAPARWSEIGTTNKTIAKTTKRRSVRATGLLLKGGIARTSRSSASLPRRVAPDLRTTSSGVTSAVEADDREVPKRCTFSKKSGRRTIAAS